jgi:serine/threonine protein kinase
MKKVGEAGMSWEFKIKIAINIAEALRFLHSQNPKILHRDLKSPNGNNLNLPFLLSPLFLLSQL